METAYAQLATPNGTSIYAIVFSKFMDYFRQCGISVADLIAMEDDDDVIAALQCIWKKHCDSKVKEIILQNPDITSRVAAFVDEIDWTPANDVFDVLVETFSRRLISKYFSFLSYSPRPEFFIMAERCGISVNIHSGPENQSYESVLKSVMAAVRSKIAARGKRNTKSELLRLIAQIDPTMFNDRAKLVDCYESFLDFLIREYKNTLLNRFQNTYRTVHAQIKFCLSLCNPTECVGILYDTMARRFHGDEIALINFFKAHTTPIADQSYKLHNPKEISFLLASYLPSKDVIRLAQTSKAWRNVFAAPSSTKNSLWHTLYKSKFFDIVPTSYPKVGCSWLRIFQYAQYKKNMRLWHFGAAPFREFLREMNETITDYPSDLVFKRKCTEADWIIAANKDKGSKVVKKTNNNLAV